GAGSRPVQSHSMRGTLSWALLQSFPRTSLLTLLDLLRESARLRRSLRTWRILAERPLPESVPRRQRAVHGSERPVQRLELVGRDVPIVTEVEHPAVQEVHQDEVAIGIGVDLRHLTPELDLPF